MGRIGIPSSFNKGVVDKFFKNRECIAVGNDGYPYKILPILKEGGLVVSGGVGGDISFEVELYKRFKPEIIIFDPGEESRDVLEKHEDIPLKYVQKALSGKNGKQKFSQSSGKNGYVRNKVESDENYLALDCESLSSIAKNREIDLLKIDIEGSEYEVIDDIINNKLKVNQIVVEFHQWFKDIPISRTLKTIYKLKKAGYKLVHKRIDDYTFVKKDILKNLKK